MDHHSLLSTQIGAAAVCAYLVQLLQKWSKAPWITEHTAGINAAVRIVTSGFAALGVSWAWGDISNGGHTLTFTIPAGTVILAGLWHWFTQYAVQHGWAKLFQVGEPTQTQLPLIAAPAGQPPLIEPSKEKP